MQTRDPGRGRLIPEKDDERYLFLHQNVDLFGRAEAGDDVYAECLARYAADLVDLCPQERRLHCRNPDHTETAGLADCRRERRGGHEGHTGIHKRNVELVFFGQTGLEHGQSPYPRGSSLTAIGLFR
jgi:hypothetical protein